MKVNMTKVLKSLDWQCVVHKLDVLSRVVLVICHTAAWSNAYRTLVLIVFFDFFLRLATNHGFVERIVATLAAHVLVLVPA